MSPKELCILLAKADTEKEIIKILKKARYWDDPNVWCYYGGNEDNFGTIGNQQSSPDAALVEKLVNSVDAVLMRECLIRGINPESDVAPQGTRDALQKFFNIDRGKLINLTATSRTELGKNIMLVATGVRSNPSYSIIDKGEGKTPKTMPETFLSLARSNKLRIPFVQGRFNMGGTGALQFCGKHNLQLIISKRCPQIPSAEEDDTVDYWGFTIVRRVDPEKGMKNSAFKYLAPGGEILKFKSQSLPLLPGDYPNACVNTLEWGSFIKLYEYQLIGLKAPVYFDLYYRLSLLLPNIALPILMYERRKGYTAQSYHITMSGLSVRLDEDKRENLETDFPNSSNITIMGQKMNLLIYVFKREKRGRYSRNEGIVFTVNGQAHGFLPATFFSRKAVGLTYLGDSILVIADCSEFDRRTQEDLFMNSRDRLRSGDIRAGIEKELEELLRKHEGLRELKERRRREEIEGKIGEAKPLLETIEKIIKKSPTLSTLFVRGVKLTNPFDLRGVTERKIFKGKKHPSYFKLIKELLFDKPKHCPRNRRFKVQFETDAENEYFTRESHPGRFTMWANNETIDFNSLNLWNGLATLTGSFPENIKIGDTIHFECETEDDTLIDPFYNEFFVKVEKPQVDLTKHVGTGERQPPSEQSGEDRRRPSHLALPNMIEVRKKDWEKHKFTRENALSVKYAGEETGYDFHINMDNIHLQTEIKGRPKSDPQLLEAQYKYGMVLVGLALLNEFENEKNNSGDKSEGEDRERKISIITQAISPFLLPMIYSLGNLSEVD